ncbi:MAG: SDR family NAD(P)-dependent oxidoreductase, partial [Candidatus Rokubacteria bacterium]|nr:SDR family NAD(P)-dependent oxidoreductase [Candidatus Rokubacteria bacterium]
MDLGIRDRVALVTGGARSLGRADALALAAEGCRIAIIDLNAEGAEETAKEIATGGGVARGYACDIRERAQVAAVITRIENEVGPVDICVNNAGVSIQKPAEEMTEEDWDNIVDINLKGVFLCSQAAARIMIPQGRGSIISI